MSSVYQRIPCFYATSEDPLTPQPRPPPVLQSSPARCHIDSFTISSPPKVRESPFCSHSMEPLSSKTNSSGSPLGSCYAHIPAACSGKWGRKGGGQPEIHLLQISYKSSDRFTSRWLWLSFQFRFYSPLPRTSGILASSCGPGRKSPLGVLPQRRSSPITCAPLNLIRAGRRMPDTNTINQRVLKEGSAPRLFPSVFLAANAFRRSSEHIH